MTTQQRYPRYVILNRAGDMAVAGDEADAHAAGAWLAPDGVLMFRTRSDAQEYIRKVTASDLADLGLEPDGLVAVNVEQDSPPPLRVVWRRGCPLRQPLRRAPVPRLPSRGQ